MFRIFSEWLRVFYIGLALGSQSIAWTPLALASSSRDYTYSNATSEKIAIYRPQQKKKTTTLVQIEIKSQLCSRNPTKNTRSTHFSPTIRLCAIPSVMVAHIGKSRRHLRFTFTSLCYEKMDSLFAAPAVAQRLFPSHQRTHRRTRHVACGAHRHSSRTHHAHRQCIDT